MPKVKSQSPAPTTIVSAQSPDERNYERTLAAITHQRQRLSELERELRLVRDALLRFEAVCHARVGDLLEQLRDVAIAIARYERRLDPSLADDELPDFPTEEFQRDAEELGGEPPDAETAPRRRQPSHRLPAHDEAEAKRMYKQLARRFHPDYAAGEEDREQRESMMQAVNEAYRARDLPALRALYGQAEVLDPTFGNRSLAVRLAWARAELVRLNAIVDSRGDELANLRGMEIHRLWRRFNAGEPVLDQLEDQLEEKLATQGRRLDQMIASYRRLQAERPIDATLAAAEAGSRD